MQQDKSYLTIIGKKIDVDTYLKYEADENYEYIMPGDSSISMSMPYAVSYTHLDVYKRQGHGGLFSGAEV